MKKLAARDFEDLLQVRGKYCRITVSRRWLRPQCSIPCFDGLLKPEHNEQILTLLYVILSWHALAKLRIHTDITINKLRICTVRLGKELRSFQKDVCVHYDTYETAREAQARVRNGPDTATTGKKKRSFNILTSKIHALGDYCEEIIQFGTTDNYSTHPVWSFLLYRGCAKIT